MYERLQAIPSGTMPHFSDQDYILASLNNIFFHFFEIAIKLYLECTVVQHGIWVILAQQHSAISLIKTAYCSFENLIYLHKFLLFSHYTHKKQRKNNKNHKIQ
ncbi:hypothetical protein A9255_19630 [Xenorhabdus hominickii]|uniref:Uncharacterized protein n=1 Tax=Xenorhabdus hominickii TaxID=351679 RepID=A0ABN4S886_XENHO|nr:hypothetical protein A9255_19630 [Xenorhabdus hominickii]